MGSTVERPDLDALHELEEVLHHLAEELGAWRRRALTAEARLGDPLRAPEGGEAATRQLRELEEENGALAQRLEAARGHLAGLLGRLTFLEEQALPETSAKTAKD